MIVLLIILFWTSLASAAEIFVDNTIPTPSCVGTYRVGVRDCLGGPGGPTAYKTWQAAFNVVVAGDTISVRSGTYTDKGAVLNAFGSSGAHIIIRGYPTDSRPVMQSAARDPIGGGDLSYALIINVSSTARYVDIRYLEFDEIVAGNTVAACVYIGAPQATVTDVIMRNCANNGIQMFSSNITVSQSTVKDCGRVQPPGAVDTKGLGFYIAPAIPNDAGYKAENNIFENNTVDGCRGGGGVIHYTYSDNNIIRSNIFKNAGQYSPWPDPGGVFQRTADGVNIGGAGFYHQNPLSFIGPQGNKIYNNLFLNFQYTDGGFGHILWGASGPGAGNVIASNTYYNVGQTFQLNCNIDMWNMTIRNQLYSNVSSQDNRGTCSNTFTGTLTESNNIFGANASTTFLDLIQFKLKTGATAINAGANLASLGITTDFFGTSRPQGSAYDVGYAEFQSSAAITVSTPSTSGSYISTASTVTITGVASCSASFTSVTWTNDRGGSGTASGFATWTISSATLTQDRVNKFTITVLCSDASTATATLYVRANRASRYVLRLPLNEGSGTSVSDTSGLSNNGTFGGSGNAWVAGKYGNAVSMNGSGYISVADADSLDLSVYALGFWAYPTSGSTLFRAGIVKNYKYFLYVTETGGCADGGPMGGFSETSNWIACSSTPLPLNSWSYLAVTYDGANIKFYVNAVLIQTTPATEFALESTGTLQIGASQFGEGFVGYVDEPQIYSQAIALNNGTGDACADSIPSITQWMNCALGSPPPGSPQNVTIGAGSTVIFGPGATVVIGPQ